MPRALRLTEGGLIYHVLNRGNARMRIFDGAEDYALLLSTMSEVFGRVPMRLLGYCIMPNHWHLILWPRGDGDLSEFMRLLGVTHTQRWHSAHGTTGTGHVYQGRFKSFPIQQTRVPAAKRAMGVVEGGDAVLSVLRYVERNPLKANLVARAEDWPYSSLHRRFAKISADPAWQQGETQQILPPLTDIPGGLPDDWCEIVNTPQTEEELTALQQSITRNSPFGRKNWIKQVAEKWNLQSTLRKRGRPKKDKEEDKDKKGSRPLYLICN